MKIVVLLIGAILLGVIYKFQKRKEAIICVGLALLTIIIFNSIPCPEKTIYASELEELKAEYILVVKDEDNLPLELNTISYYDNFLAETINETKLIVFDSSLSADEARAIAKAE